MKLIKEMDYDKGGLGWKVWGTALVLSWRLVSLQKGFHDKRVLELGSGCGLCGLLAAKLGACEVVLTDFVPDILTNLCENARLLPAMVLEPKELCQSPPHMGHTKWSFDFAHGGEDAGLVPKEHSAMIRVRMLDWAEDASGSMDNKDLIHLDLPKLSAEEQFDWVIGSDLIYNQYNITSLVGVVKRRLLKKGGRALFGAPVRDTKELNLFLSELDALGMDAHVERCSQQEWETCMALMEAEEGGTLHGVDHYAGGLVIIHVMHKV